jgi:transposase
VFLDETGLSTAMTRPYGRAPRGRRLVEAVPEAHWEMTTLIAAIRRDGVAAALEFPGATDTLAFRTYVEEVLVPALRPGDIVVMDNLACHKSAGVARLIGAAGACVRYLPPYSPDLNPIEQLFSKLKASLRAAAARTIGAVVGAMGEALRAVRPGDIRGWFAHSGYPTVSSTVTVNEKPH